MLFRSSYPFIVGGTQQYAAPVTEAEPAPRYYPVPVPVARYTREPEVPPPPYDPTRARMVVIGAGRDGGGGVMRIVRLSGDSLRVTMLDLNRPVREAKFFLADSMQRAMRTHVVDLDHPEVLFNLTGLDRPISYTGLTVVFADGSTRTTLVPY